MLATTYSGDEVSVFDNGATTRRVEWVRDGHGRELAYPRAAAAEFGASFTPPTDNLLLTGGADASLDDMVASTERGLLLTCLWYIREVDPTTLLLTGLTRDGVYLVEGGEVVGEVEQLPVQRVAARPAAPRHRGRRHRAHAAARVEGLVHPRRHAPAARARLPHDLGVAGPLMGSAHVSDLGRPGYPNHSRARSASWRA